MCTGAATQVKATCYSFAAMKRRAVALLAALAMVSPATVWCWGWEAHHYIAQNYSKHLPAVIDGLRAHDSIVDQKVNDPDIRRPYTPGESYRHYIDIDRYPEFLLGTLPHDRAALEALYGAGTVLTTGIVPWAVGEVVATLTQQLAARQWTAAASTIADLCHYVGDATQPLHCTENYDGQLTGNGGIHARYETAMISAHIGELHTPAIATTHYPDVVEAMFDIVEGSWDGVRPVLDADNAARAASGGAFNSVYYASLWTDTEMLTRARIDAATLATASFVHTAWKNAGQPPVPGSSETLPPPPIAAGPARLEAGPSPFRDALNIRFDGPGPLVVDIFDLRGARIMRLVEGVAGAGTLSWTPPGGVNPGLYFVRLTSPERSIVRRVTRLE